jgi:hypothetical protein
VDAGSVGERPLRPGDVVEVRPPGEILATLDGDSSADAMPFMPEMLRHVGRRFTVSRRVEKICDTVTGGPPSSRRMRGTVLLEDLRCDGSAHGGCQAGCRLYWRESWLRRVDSGDPAESRECQNGHARLEDPARLEELAVGGTRAVGDPDDEPTESYRCQATEALRASEPLSRRDLRHYVRELTSGNVGPLHFLRVSLRALGTWLGRRLRVLGWQPLPQADVTVPTRGDLNLQPGEMVEVRSPEEVAGTVDESGKTRGLSFDWEMAPYCGGRYHVQDRVERIIDETTGRMIEISSDCLILEGVVCSGEHSNCRYFCPRGIYPYWREAWLRRVDNG